MQHVEITTLCDRCGAKANDHHPDLRFTWQAVAYSIDLCDKCFATLDKTIGPFAAAARRAETAEKRAVGNKRGDRVLARKRAAPAGTDRERNQQIRTWAADNGYTVSVRGRIGEDVITAYNAAHPA